MNKAELLQRRDLIQAKFNEVEKKRGEAETEMARLQGEFRLVNDLIKELDEKAKSEKAEAQKED